MYYKPKKRLGQNFLVDKNIQNKIIDACDLKPQDYVLEIGAGKGELTNLICQRVKHVLAFEIDGDLYNILKEKLFGYSNVKIINQDILKFDFKKIRSHFDAKIKVVGNIPYYICSPIIQKLAEFRGLIQAVYITVQKEFARRMTASFNSRDYSSFSCFVQYYFDPKVFFEIKKGCFLPQPKVDSSFLRLCVKKTPLSKRKEKLLFQIIRAAFNKRRKTLKNSLKDVVSRERLNQFFAKNKINPDIRPERLSLADFQNLAKT